MKQDRTKSPKSSPKLSRTLKLYLIVMHILLVFGCIAFALIVKDSAELTFKQREAVARHEGLQQCVHTESDIKDCQNLISRYVNHFYIKDHKIMYGDHFSIEGSPGFMRNVVVDSYGKVIISE